MKKEKIYEEIMKERERQDKVWGGYEHDKKHNHRDWVSFIIMQLGFAQDEAEAGNTKEYKEYMIRVAALVMACLECLSEKDY